MERDTGKYTWTEGLPPIAYPTLEGTQRADVAIIGGGLAGVWAAYLLTAAGKRVILLEEDYLGSGATKETTAFITEYIDTDAVDLIHTFGLSIAQEIYRSHHSAIELIASTVKKEKIECELAVCSHNLYATNPPLRKELEEELEALRLAGVEASFESEGGFANTGMVSIADQAVFHPMLFLLSLSDRAARGGARLFENSSVTSLQKKDGWLLSTAKGTVSAPVVISATYSPFEKPLRLFFKKAKYVSYVFELSIPPGAIPPGTYEDMQNPYHYFRVDAGKGEDRVIVGGEDHRDDLPISEEKSFKALEEFAQKTFPSFKVRRKWQGPILESVDGLAFIGPLGNDSTLLYTTGFSGNGMTYAALSAMLLRDLILQKKNPWIPIYAANRFPRFKALAVKGKDYAEELLKGGIKNTLKQPHESDAPKEDGKKDPR